MLYLLVMELDVKALRSKLWEINFMRLPLLFPIILWMSLIIKAVLFHLKQITIEVRTVKISLYIVKIVTVII